jgi:ubiquinone/menaquinone biosynthesis C-methylase UbiE
MSMSGMNDSVRSYWEQEPCGTGSVITGETERFSLEWYERVEKARYLDEPCVHAIAQFTRYHGKKVLEIGVGSGTDHLQWARAGAKCYGVDLTDAAITTTARRLALYGFSSELQRVDAETLPFPDGTFDVVYSWGVIHHSEHPEKILAEIRRVLKDDGKFLGMMYGRHSLLVYKLWIKHALLSGQPMRSLADVLWNHMESVGTKAYTVGELSKMFDAFSAFRAIPIMTPYDLRKVPRWLGQFVPQRFGWFIGLEALK